VWCLAPTFPQVLKAWFYFSPLAPAHCSLLMVLGSAYDFRHLQVKLVNFAINWGWMGMSGKKRKKERN